MNLREAEQFARAVADSMTRLRGWAPGTVPREVVDDVFATMTRHDAVYVAGFRDGVSPDVVARQIQDTDWSRSRP